MHPLEVLLVPLGRALRGRRAEESQSLSHAPELTVATRFTLSSPSFGDGEAIPAKHCGPLIGENVSPALAWSGLPEGTADLVLLLEDIDSPAPPPRIHTIAAFASGDGALAEGALRRDNPDVRFLRTPHGGIGYAGPRPLPGHGPHRYRFHLYALDERVDLAAVTDAALLPAALAGHVLASATLIGTRSC